MTPLDYLALGLGVCGLLAFVLCFGATPDGRRSGRFEIMASSMGLIQVAALINRDSNRSEQVAAAFLIFVFTSIIAKQALDWRRARAGVLKQP